MTDERSPAPGEFLLYETEDGQTRVECRFVKDSLWLELKGAGSPFGKFARQERSRFALINTA